MHHHFKKWVQGTGSGIRCKYVLPKSDLISCNHHYFKINYTSTSFILHLTIAVYSAGQEYVIMSAQGHAITSCVTVSLHLYRACAKLDEIHKADLAPVKYA